MQGRFKCARCLPSVCDARCSLRRRTAHGPWLRMMDLFFTARTTFNQLVADTWHGRGMSERCETGNHASSLTVRRTTALSAVSDRSTPPSLFLFFFLSLPLSLSLLTLDVLCACRGLQTKAGRRSYGGEKLSDLTSWPGAHARFCVGAEDICFHPLPGCEARGGADLRDAKRPGQPALGAPRLKTTWRDQSKGKGQKGHEAHEGTLPSITQVQL